MSNPVHLNENAKRLQKRLEYWAITTAGVCITERGSKAAPMLHEESTKVFVETVKKAAINTVSVILNCAVPSQVEFDEIQQNIIRSYDGNLTKVCMFF